MKCFCTENREQKAFALASDMCHVKAAHHWVTLKAGGERGYLGVMADDLSNGVTVHLAQSPLPNRAPGAAWES